MERFINYQKLIIDLYFHWLSHESAIGSQSMSHEEKQVVPQQAFVFFSTIDYLSTLVSDMPQITL